MKTKSVILGIIMLFVVGTTINDFSKEEPLYIAFIGPMSGEGKAAGEIMTQAIQLYLDQFNSRGGINGRKVDC
ncbi:MAG: hypothetical protein DRR08_27360 [Candidatus Parabeggiatoa sp. nov. 2]|nr:MAG: hypothetical protein B6247_30220 [Beggiatoa sp. 4572_84]RKZ53453.1 MAG: hypothetical protein DRR08_27360 [Gammaproteobacteria bacterium]